LGGYLLPSPLRARYHLRLMNHDVTRLLSALGRGDPHAASRQLPLAYEELRKLAAQRMPQEQPGQKAGPPGRDSRGIETTSTLRASRGWPGKLVY
jgi:hypothetical protein